jgi:hypothetical protein
VAVQKAYGLAVLDDGSLPAYDPYWSNTVLLLHGDGANLSGTITDSSPSAHAMTAAVAALSTTQAKFGSASLDVATSYSSANFVTASDKLTDFQFGAGQFTVEAWVRFRAFEAAQQHVICAAGWVTGNSGWKLGWNAGQLRFTYSVDGTTFSNVTVANTPSLDTWHHVAVDRDASNTLRLYFNGAVVASGAAAATFFPSTATFYLGNDPNHNRALSGWLDDVRITKGVARYGGAFAVPLAAFPDSGAPTVAVTRRRPLVALLG